MTLEDQFNLSIPDERPFTSRNTAVIINPVRLLPSTKGGLRMMPTALLAAISVYASLAYPESPHWERQFAPESLGELLSNHWPSPQEKAFSCGRADILKEAAPVMRLEHPKSRLNPARNRSLVDSNQSGARVVVRSVRSVRGSREFAGEEALGGAERFRDAPDRRAGPVLDSNHHRLGSSPRSHGISAADLLQICYKGTRGRRILRIS